MVDAHHPLVLLPADVGVLDVRPGVETEVVDDPVPDVGLQPRLHPDHQAEEEPGRETVEGHVSHLALALAGD